MRFRRLSAFVVSIAVLLASLMPVYATSRGVDDAVINHVVVPFERMVTTSVESIGRMLGSVQDESFKLIRNCYEFWSGLISEAVLDYDGFVDDLDRTDATRFYGVDGFYGTTAESTSYFDMLRNLQSLDFPFFSFLEQCGVNQKAMVLAGTDSFLWGFYFDGAGALQVGKFTNPMGTFNSSLCTMWDLTSLMLENSYQVWGYGCDALYYSAGHAKGHTDFLTSDVAYIDWDRCVGVFPGSVSQYQFELYAFVKPASDVVFGDESSLINVYNGTNSTSGDFTRLKSMYCLTSFSLNDGLLLYQPTDVDASSRTSSLMQAIHTYNTNNSYVDNSTNVNFFLVPSGEDPTEDTVVSPVIYDEENLVYTDPVTGTQYLTNGWTYDYLTRCYTLDMADESYLIGETVIDTIKLTYGDELLTVDHYSGGSLIQSDKYNYVMLSGSACAIDGHTYNVETTKEPTCTAAGERTYTCSVCGNQYVEEIPQTDHIYADFTVVHEATCTSKGITSYTCSTCGGEYTELLEALGHDWQPTAATEEAYVMPDNVNCPDCYGSDFTYTRSDYEILTGKNLFDFSRVSVAPERSDRPWISEVGDDYIVISSTVDMTSTVGSCSTDLLLCELMPDLIPGRTYTLSFVSDSKSGRGLYIIGFGIWRNGQSLTITEDALSCFVNFYGFDYKNLGEYGDCRLSKIQVELGTEVTEYEPYDPNYIELVPPLYHFTCLNPECGTVWTKEAVFQGSSVTFSCTRCGAEKIEVEEIPLEEEGWFDFMGDLIKSFFSSIVGAVGSGLSALLSAVVDFFGWIFGFLTDAVLIGVRNFFDSFSDDSSIFDGFKQENEDGSTTVVLPSGVATVFQFFSGTVLLLPDDLRLVLIFGVAALFLIAVFKLRP